MPKTINEGTEDVALSLLKTHPRNVNQGDFGAIQESIETNGFVGTIVANKRTNHILIGNHRYQVAKAQGFSTIPVTWVDVDDETEVRIMLADNRTARLGQDNEAALSELLAELAQTETGLTGTGFDGDDLDRLINDLANNAEPSGKKELLTDPDEMPNDAPTRCEQGDLWQLGRHRLLCGDSTKANDVARLMNGRRAGIAWADPPYGYSYQSNMRTQTPKFDVLHNDNKILDGFIPSIDAHSEGWALICTSWKVVSQWIEAGQPLGNLQNVIVWDKGGGGMGDLVHSLSTDYELILAYNRGAEICGKRLGSVWSIGKDRASDYLHATQKPVELINQALDTFAPEGCLIYDPFMGSGTAIISAEQTMRTCYGMELEPKHCDVILARWEAATGQTAKLIEHGTTDQIQR